MRIARCALWILALIWIAGAARCASEAPESEPPALEAAGDAVPLVALEAVARNPEGFAGRPLRIAGTLESVGKNYFTDLRVVLKNDRGDSVYVRPWLAMELPPAPPGAGGQRPDVLSRYLGKRVELTAVLDRGALKNVGQVYLLKVDSARIIESGSEER